jgi:hypothetical protein
MKSELEYRWDFALTLFLKFGTGTGAQSIYHVCSRLAASDDTYCLQNQKFHTLPIVDVTVSSQLVPASSSDTARLNVTP